MDIRDALTFDDVLLEPARSNVLPAKVKTSTYVTRSIEIGIPLLSSAMDTVTESRIAIVMAQAGGIGVVHKNLDITSQANEVRAVKKFEAGMVINPVTIHPEAVLAEAMELMKRYGINGIPVVQKSSGKLVGILTHRDVRFATNDNQPINELMTKHVITVGKDVKAEEARALLHKNRIEKLLVIDGENRCIGLITVKDMEKAQSHPNAAKDEKARLRVAAATGVGNDGIARAEALIDAEVDIIVIDTAHGHSDYVMNAVQEIRKLTNYTQIIAGNVATADGARSLINAGADGIKIGIGPGSICTTRVVAGVGVPQLTAILDVSKVCHEAGVPCISDGGIKYSGDLAKAIAAGADCGMVGSLLAGTDESPGEVYLYQGRSYKAYRGMGSMGAMARGSADRYFQEDVSNTLKLVPEGIEGQVPYKGPAGALVQQLVGGLQAAMGYTGCISIKELQNNAKFLRISNAGLKESHVHNVTITREAPNYLPDI
ncbi:inosine-5'-monophosphate dehydrogenase [Candidatus Endolissoclinum faulkneri L2]|uniref:Inosine-5'-monophosphate dehydrogenase n=1 Tax=Candidatus Endolissoclinum faulkneri L2 TaxID=1193729 RepID=K7YPT6_9PROT|nr:IMP dehydrogenase [Candidatus Endolissoclinum faulkneri]AFX99547.1 inosine-5'-monophosphate dehydrogenase [Candidatus Endolissoclinum faulkneri L2]